MVKRLRTKCSVPGCTHDWMVASVRRLAFCDLHYRPSLQAYNDYKEATKTATCTFEDSDIRHAATLRTNFTNMFTKGEPDWCAHTEFVSLLLNLLKHPLHKRRMVFDTSIIQFHIRHNITK